MSEPQSKAHKPIAQANVSFSTYLKGIGAALLSAVEIYDLATSAEKMVRWDCVGSENEAWRHGPYLSSGAGEEQIDRTRPYCLRMSVEFSKAASLVLGPNPKIEANGGVRAPMRRQKEEPRGAEETIAKYIIIEQFESYKDFFQQLDGPTNAASCKKWVGRLDEKI